MKVTKIYIGIYLCISLHNRKSFATNLNVAKVILILTVFKITDFY